jgi:hypothetical protein
MAVLVMIAGNIPDRPSFVGINRERWKRAMVEHFRDIKFTHALTLAWNCSRSLETAKKDLKKFHAMVDRKLLGRTFNQRPKTGRTTAVFVFEGVGPGGHLHVHSLWRVADRHHHLRFAKLVQGANVEDKLTGEVERAAAWNKIAKSGSHALALMSDWRAFAGYALKDQHMSSDAREIVWSDEFYRE